MRMVRTKKQGQVKKFTLFKNIEYTFTLKNISHTLKKINTNNLSIEQR